MLLRGATLLLHEDNDAIRVSRDTDFLIEDDLIARIGKSLPVDDVKVIDCRQKMVGTIALLIGYVMKRAIIRSAGPHMVLTKMIFVGSARMLRGGLAESCPLKVLKSLRGLTTSFWTLPTDVTSNDSVLTRESCITR